MQMTSGGGRGAIRLDTNQVIGSGGEAKVYAVKGNRNVVAKVYHQPTPERADKLRAMVGHAPADPVSAQGHVSIAWPEDLLLEPRGTVVGYLMPAIRNSYPFSDVYHPEERKRSLPAGFGYRYLIRTAHNLCSAVSAIHDMGYVIGDLNDCNILVQADARVTLIDCDSFQIGSYRCPVGVPMYTAPELQGVTLSSVDRQAEQDCFGLAVLVYQLLMSGVHPYAGVGEPGALNERIKAALCPYAPGGPKPPRGAPLLEWLPPSLQQLVRATFVDSHAVPRTRPSAREWADQLLSAEKELVACRRDRNHPYFKHSSDCPACRAQAARRRQARKVNATATTANPWQQPWPALGLRGNRSARRKFAMLAVLIVAFMLAYNWPSMSDLLSPLATQAGTDERDADRTSPYPVGKGLYPERSSRRTETGSEIYLGSIGQSPYRNGEIQAIVNVAGSSDFTTAPSPYSVPGGKEIRAAETGSEIYRQYLGKNPY